MVSSFRPKYQRKNLTISALEFEKWSNQQNKGIFYNTLIYLWIYGLFKVLRHYRLPLSYKLITFQIPGQTLSNIFVGILVETMTAKGHFEINWPLPHREKKHLFSSKAGLFCDSSFSWTSFHTAESLHTVSFGWILSGSEWNLNLKFCLLKLLIFYQKFLWNIRSRLKFSTFWVSEPVLTCLIKIFILCVKSFIFD